MRIPHNPNSRAQIAKEIDSLSKDATHWARRAELLAAGRSLADSDKMILNAAKIAKEAATMLQAVVDMLLLQQGVSNENAAVCSQISTTDSTPEKESAESAESTASTIDLG